MNAIHGSKATHDKIAAHKMAVLLRGGMLPQADVYPTALRATRDRLRRRMALVHQRAEWLPHVQQPNSQDHLPAPGQNIAYKANRHGVAARVPDLAVQKRVAVELVLIDSSDPLRSDLE